MFRKTQLMLFSYLIFSLIIYECVGVITVLVDIWIPWFTSFIMVTAYKCLHIKIILLAALSKVTVTKSSVRESIVSLSPCLLKMDSTDLHVILFWRVWIFSSPDNKHDFSIWKIVIVHVFVIWYNFNELINTNFYFSTSFRKTNLFWLSILWNFGYELRILSLLTMLDSPVKIGLLRLFINELFCIL